MDNICGHKQEMRIINELKPYDIYTNLGKAIAVGELVDCRPMTKDDEDACFAEYHEGKYCHVYKNVRPIEPIAFKGKQGWSSVSPDLENSLKYI